MQIRWLIAAINDLVELKEYISKENPVAAREVAAHIKEATKALKDHPSMGKPGRVEDTRELVVPGLPYTIPYRVKGETIQILRVLHQTMKWPGKL